MKIFLLDLWHDLREKRLAPVAVVLLAGLVAVPIVLAKPAADPGPAPVAPATSSAQEESQAEAALAKVKLGEDEAGKGSTLGVFDPDNPFSPPKGTIKSDDVTAGTAGPGDTGTPAGGTGPDTGTPGDTGSGGVGTLPGTGGTPTTPGTGGGGTTTTETTVYKYVVDITFEVNGRARRIKGLEKLDMLPNDSSPLLIFMGVTSKGSDAVFLVDSTLEAAGEGRCKPSPSECAFAYIGAGSEYVFTEDDGDTYMVKVDEIRKVKVDANASSAKGAKARASVGPQRRFVPPVLADLVVVASETVENSNNDSNSR
jgi:hypothetical protein